MSGFGLDPASWAIVNRLLDEALDLAPEERSRWLDALPPEHQVFRSKLEELLAQDGREARLTTLPAIEGDPAEPGIDVGPYRLLRRLGEGGMGDVWLAERSDGMLKRPVALKLPRSFEVRPELGERMAREREILAALTHPNIARLYDAGVTKDGQPYLALEYVEGEPIDRYVETRRLSVNQRLVLFLQVAKAIAYAHGRLIIHRDIKPANILVTKDGEVRLLDFGIAKLLDRGRAEETDLTRESGRPLTIAYASPEQILGDVLSVGSDVYSLGVVLYELLSSARPYRPERASAGALEDAVLHAEPIRPSDAASDPAVKRKLRGDLDTIVLKAMKKDPRVRYATVDAFAEDVERHLLGHPVLARPDSAAYRIRKFVGRHTVAVGAAVAVLLSIVAGAGIAVWQAQVALAEKARAEEVKSFIASIFKDANVDRGAGKPLTAVELLVQARERIDRSLTQPEVRLELRRIVGESLVSLYDTTVSDEVLSQAIEESSALLGPEHIATLRTRLTRGWSLMFRGKEDELGKELDQLLPLFERNPETTATDVVQVYRLKTHVEFRKGKFAEAVASAERGLAIAERELPKEDQHRLRILIQLAEALSFDEKNERARETIERAHDLSLELFPDNPKHPTVVLMREIYAVVLARSGDPEGALEQLARVLEDRISLYGADAVSVGNLHNNMVHFQLQAGRIADALKSSELAVEISSKHGGPDSIAAATAINGRGRALLRAKRADALEPLARSLEFATRTFGENHPNTLSTRANHALALAWADRMEEALRESSAMVEAVRASGAPIPAPFLVDGTIRRMSKDHAGARRSLEEALARTKNARAAWLDRANINVELGLVRLETGDLSGAAEAVEAAVESFERERKTIAPEHADALIALGRVRLEQGRAAEALPLFERAADFWQTFDAKSRWSSEAAAWRSRCRAVLGQRR